MKRRKHRLSIPQHEFGFAPAAFNLAIETGLDGERITRERAEADHARRMAEAAQPALFTTTKNHYER
jgi:hypothetical protein